MPKSWYYSDKKDSLNIKDIYKKYGNNKKLKTYPFLNFIEYLFFAKNRGKYLTPLHYMNYDPPQAKKILTSEIGWQDYGEKHHESFITKFYQNYILPQKFNIDKRKPHLSSLICSNQISRKEALEELKKPMYANKKELENDKVYFIKKINISENEFIEIMNRGRKEHSDFKSYNKIKKKYIDLLKVIRKFHK
jgi:hypothetical protein